MLGYTVRLRDTVFAADTTKVGVQLGRRAINCDIPVVAIAEHLGVSRQTVYDWFIGRFNMTEERAEALRLFIDEQ